MARTLNPTYLRQIIDSEHITGLAVVFLTGQRLGVSVSDDRLLTDRGWVDTDAPRRFAEGHLNYRGWSVLGALFCRSCWSLIRGIPRDIIKRNHCETCQRPFYSNEDPFLDMVGFEVYRDRCTRYSSIAARRFATLIEDGHHSKKNGGISAGFHKDHILSVRDGFEQDLPTQMISSPVNLRVVTAGKNLAKSRKSTQSRVELEARYCDFVTAHPEWLTLIEKSDANQPTFVHPLPPS